MDKKTLAIYDSDPEFVFRFMEFARTKGFLAMEIRAFTSEEHLCAFAESRVPELLLVTADVLTEQVKKIPAKNRVILLEDQSGETFGDPGLYKYQSPEELLKKAAALCRNDRETGSSIHKGRTEMIGVYSPVGRTRKTSFAIALGQILAEDRSVLYLNLETFAGFEQLFAEKYERTLSDLLYFGKQQEATLSEPLSSIIRSIGRLDYVPPVLCPEDLQSVKEEEWLELLARLGGETGYEVLLLDLGEAVQGLTSLVAACDRVYMPVRSDPVSLAKLDQFFWLLGELQGKEAEGRIRKLKIPFVQISKRGREFFQELLWSEMGEFVRKLLTEEKEANL
ncbi:MAG: hypothetical protein Q4B85_06250 [Lachnospiraceae bacterium]|nr:hypothetical protein [Lachnospiraceae bacterium]